MRLLPSKLHQSIMLLVMAMLGLGVPARAFDTVAQAAWVYDMTTQTVLMDKNADTPLPPASMSKLMTLNMLFEALADGRVTMETTFAVSSRARQMGGSTMFLNEQDRPTVNDLIHGIIVNSGNDACVVVAEGLAGSEEAFAAQMNVRALALGMENSNFTNSSGWPDPDHRMSMKDLGIIARRLIEEFPQYYPIFSQTNFNYQNRAEANANNRNPLLRLDFGAGGPVADGLKTGHTSEAGYGLVGSAVQGDRRIIFVITGLPSEEVRAEEAEQIVNWAFRQFAVKTLVTAGTRVAEAEVWMGDAATIGLVPAQDARFLVPALVQDQVTAEVVYTGPIAAPITQGAQVAELVIHIPDLPDARVPLMAETDVARGGFIQRITTAGRVLWTRYMAGANAS
jgi:serine-type D-Ala-D-Ala carboxypeptidase (penicillin-binding protein 5/6)